MSHYYPRHVSGLDMPILMHGRKNIKLHKAEQAKPVHQYKDTKIKLYKNNAAIWYNKICRARQITSTYANKQLFSMLHLAKVPRNHVTKF